MTEQQDAQGMLSAVLYRHADRPFLIDSATGRQLTYAGFADLSCRAAGLMYASGVRRSDRVMLLLTNSIEFAACYFGCLFLGAAAVPLGPAAAPRDVAYAVAHSRVKLVIHSEATAALAEAVPEIGATQNIRLRNAELLLATEPPPVLADSPVDNVSGDHLFSITFTSGTTSSPKAVAHRVGSLLQNAEAFNDALGFGPEHRFLHVMPMAYMAGFLNTLICPFMAGASVVLAPPFDGRSILRFWEPVLRYRADTFWLAPTMLAALLQIDRNRAGREYCRESVKAICVGTAPLPVTTKRDFESAYGIELFESYGLSELLLISGNSSRFPRVPGSAGRVLPGIDIRATAETGDPVRPGTDGELWVRTPYVMAGYLNAHTCEPDPVSHDSWFPTGDIGHVTTEGDVLITGRKKDLIIRGGVNVSPRAVEEVLLEHDAVDKVAVVGVPHELYGEQVVAVVALGPGRSLATERASLESFCRQRLNSAAVPNRFVAVEKFPETITGKILKRELRQLIQARQL